MKRTLLVAIVVISLAGGAADAASPRSERVTSRIAERAYARQSIAEARAARAEARVAQIAPVVPVPPPPRPATVRRMRRAGVPLAPAPEPAAIVAAPTPRAMPPRQVSAPARASGPRSVPAPTPLAPATPEADSLVLPGTQASPPPAGPSDDGTRSVLATAEEPADTAPAREPAGAPVTHPPIELLPTP